MVDGVGFADVERVDLLCDALGRAEERALTGLVLEVVELVVGVRRGRGDLGAR